MFVTPINVAVRDTNEYVVKRILKHTFTDPNKKLWLVQWQLVGNENETLEPFEVLRTWKLFTIIAQQMGKAHYSPNSTLHSHTNSSTAAVSQTTGPDADYHTP